MRKIEELFFSFNSFDRLQNYAKETFAAKKKYSKTVSMSHKKPKWKLLDNWMRKIENAKFFFVLKPQKCIV